MPGQNVPHVNPQLKSCVALTGHIAMKQTWTRSLLIYAGKCFDGTNPHHTIRSKTVTSVPTDPGASAPKKTQRSMEGARGASYCDQVLFLDLTCFMRFLYRHVFDENDSFSYTFRAFLPPNYHIPYLSCFFKSVSLRKRRDCKRGERKLQNCFSFLYIFPPNCFLFLWMALALVWHMDLLWLFLLWKWDRRWLP